MENIPEELKHGTTTIGIVCKDGVVMATEKRATMGNFIAHKDTKKLFKIDEHLGLTIAGLVGDAQLLARYLKAEVELYKLKRNAPISVEGAATLMANILNGNRFFPYYVGLLIGGMDSRGSHVFSLDAVGGSIEDKFVSVGSGSPYAYGILEEHYHEEISTAEAVDVAIKALNAAMKRDSASGDGMSVAVITQKEFRELTDEEIKKRMTKLKL
ncbi:MAG: archaeal proteasome endopeptidase complex subunit beta [Thermoplasmata archaeon]|nr:archaeal proteasome endopeptidase complex subunit beta [Thermoplasmata archaeon]